MKSIKPGRGPSAMGAVGSLFAAVFGVIWTAAAASMGAPAFFCLFGVVFVIFGLVQAAYNFKNATGKHRYSAFDIVEGDEEPDPLNRRFAREAEPDDQEPRQEAAEGELRFCPYCGARLGENFAFCGKCGRELPDEQ